ncbi:MAG: GntR family transcriptional regulator [Variibacter sp.]|nr:GntR family transcriptional regulator [Variibacter sp.]
MSTRERDDDRRTGVKPFLYRDVATKLRERILTGVYLPNAKLPSLNELVEEFKVSAISVRRALRELAYEGLVYGEQGRGVFVKPKSIIHRVLAANADRSMGDEIERAGFQPTIKELMHDRIEADEDTAVRLRVAPGTMVHRHQKLVFADSEPVSLNFLYFTDEVAPRLTPFLAKTFVFRMLELARLHVHHSRFEFGALALGNDYAGLFKKPAGFPMGVLHFTPLTKSGKALLTGTTIFRSDRFIFELDVPYEVFAGHPVSSRGRSRRAR